MSQKILTEENTLLKYTDPFIVVPRECEKPREASEEPKPSSSHYREEPEPGPSMSTGPRPTTSYPSYPGAIKMDQDIPSGDIPYFDVNKLKAPPFGKRKRVSDLATDITPDTRSILNVIAYPIEWEGNGQQWRQEVSMEPVTRAEVWKLGENLNLRLKERRARDKGICAVRMQLFAQVFDEIIRQVSLNCLERGMLLLRIRDEYHLTIAVHQALCEGSINYGTKKASAAEEGRTETHEEIDKLEEEKAEIEGEILEMDSKFLMLERRAEELRSTQEKNHIDEINFLKKTNQQLKAQLESIAAPKKS